MHHKLAITNIGEFLIWQLHVPSQYVVSVPKYWQCLIWRFCAHIYVMYQIPLFVLYYIISRIS